MTDWWQEPYPGGPMIEVRGFPRALYPPSAAAAGKQPSADGPDIKAIKRVVSRAGRWPWGEFDDSYYEIFATGASGNVRETGVAGVQRQLGIPASGWIGKDTFNGLRSIRIPQGLPNAGQSAMDAIAVDLINKAYAQFNGSVVGARDKALNFWQKPRVGWTEIPPGSNTDNRTNGIKHAQILCAGGGSWLVGEPWCGAWCFAAMHVAGVEGIDSHVASVFLIEKYARAQAKCYQGWTMNKAETLPGDLVVIGGSGIHVEMIRGYNGANVLTYGGNTSPGIQGSQSNGGGAYARERFPHEIHGFAQVEYPGD